MRLLAFLGGLILGAIVGAFAVRRFWLRERQWLLDRIATDGPARAVWAYVQRIKKDT